MGDVFRYKAIRNTLVLYCNGKKVSTLTGDQAADFLTAAQRNTPEQNQRLMEKISESAKRNADKTAPKPNSRW